MPTRRGKRNDHPTEDAWPRPLSRFPPSASHRPRPWPRASSPAKPGDTYIMNVMVSAHPYWVPVYRGLQAGRDGDGLRGGLLGHARLRHHQADRLLRAGPRQEAQGHPAASDAGRSVHRADQPRHRERRRDRHVRGEFAEVQARLLHHLRQPRRGQVRGRRDRRAARRQGRVRGAREPRPEQPRPARDRLHRLHGRATIRT